MKYTALVDSYVQDLPSQAARINSRLQRYRIIEEDGLFLIVDKEDGYRSAGFPTHSAAANYIFKLAKLYSGTGVLTFISCDGEWLPAGFFYQKEAGNIHAIEYHPLNEIDHKRYRLR